MAFKISTEADGGVHSYAGHTTANGHGIRTNHIKSYNASGAQASDIKKYENQ